MSAARYADIVKANQRLTIQAPDALRVLDAYESRREAGNDLVTVVAVLIASLVWWPILGSFSDAATNIVLSGPLGFGVRWCWKRWRERQAEVALAARLGASGESTR